ncbi:MAG: hypothetical protein K2X87_17875 [Gemmataceae bacterium]|nr:hypothetical protein [Gemmataceae bacterium]
MKRHAQPSLFDLPVLPDHYAGPDDVTSAPGLLALAASLGAERVAGWSAARPGPLDGLPEVPASLTADVRAAIRSGRDPLGDIFCRLRTPEARRPWGATYTPAPIVDWMLDTAARWFGSPSRVVDPGTGSGRFLLAAGRRFPGAELVGVETDPLAVALACANLSAAGLADRSRVVVEDYRRADLGPVDGRTLYAGNPPYVRHHQIGAGWKDWLTTQSRRLNLSASQLSGLHVHFFLATALRARPEDAGVFITAAEWLDVNYGRLVRDLFLGPLGGRRIDVIEPTAVPFPDAATTAAISTFEFGSRPKTVTVRRVSAIGELGDESAAHPIRRERLEAEARWSYLTRAPRKAPAGYVELGELFRVHRGQVTGANKVWIAGDHSTGLPERVLFPSVTKARELFQAGPVLDDPSGLRRVIDLPAELDGLEWDDRKVVMRFLKTAERMGARQGYIASARRAWWSVGLREPAPILATYMARRPPAFVLNKADARHINIAHGLYPRERFEHAVLSGVVKHLTTAVTVAQGRTYAGGLTKFEPREMERLMIPSPEVLRQGV